MSARAALCFVFAVCLAPTTLADDTRGIPPYGVIQFGFGSMTRPEDREFLLRCHANVCEGAVYHGIRECFGWGDRPGMEKRWAGVRKQIEELHSHDIRAISYVAYHPFYGNYEQRTGFFNFYDTRWDEFKDYLGPRPPDPIEWTKRDADGNPMPFQYANSKGYYICPNNPYWLQYLDGVLHMIADVGLDGARYDGPIDPCHCKWCAAAFGKWLRGRYTAEELKNHFDIEGEGPVPAPTSKNDPLMFLWRHYCMYRQGETVAETAAAVRKYNPDFIMSYNYCIWSATRVAGSSRNEYLARASDYGLIEGNRDATAHSENGRKHTASADLKYLLASSDGKPVDMHYYLYPLGRLRTYDLARRTRQDIEPMANFWRAAIAEGMAGGCPYPIMVSYAHHNIRQPVIAYADFFYRMRPYLTAARTSANVAVLASVSQTCASLPSCPLSVSRYLSDQHIPHKIVLEQDLTEERLAEYHALVLPGAQLLSDKQVAFLKSWVHDGHGLVLFGPVATRDQYNEERPASAFADVLGLEDGGDFPQDAMRAKYGAGRLAWLPSLRLPVSGRWPFTQQAVESVRKLPSALYWAANAPFAATLEGTDMVELNLMRSPDGDVLLCHMVNYNIEAPGVVTPYTDLPLEIALPDGAAPQQVLLLSPDLATEKRTLPYQIVSRKGRRFVAVTVPRIDIYNLVAVELSGTRASPPDDAKPPVELFTFGPCLAAAGGQVTLTATLRNRSPRPVEGWRITATSPQGCQISAQDTSAGGMEIKPVVTATQTFTVSLPAGAKVEAPADINFSIQYTLAGKKWTDTARHRLMVRRPVTATLEVSEQVHPLTRRLGLRLSLRNNTDTDIAVQAQLALPPKWTAEQEAARMTVPARGDEAIDFAVILPQDLPAGEHKLAATISGAFAEAEFQTQGKCDYELKGNLLVAQCPGTDSPPQLDGKLDDACWKNAIRLADFMRIDGSAPATDQTEGFILHDAENLYIAVRCHEALLSELSATTKTDGGNVWEDDSVEVWIDIGHNEKRPFQLATNSLGARYSPQVGTGWQVKAAREAAAWTLEIAIPFKSLGNVPKAGDLWGFNLCRSRPAKGLAQNEYSAWSCTYGGFAKVENFGHIAFMGK